MVNQKAKKATGLINWWLRNTRFIGITLPPFGIYVLEEQLNNSRLLKHEQQHWKQYQDLGAIMFYIKYVWYSLIHGYKNNPMEIEARSAETKI